MKYFVECCGCDYRNGKTKGVNMGLGVENLILILNIIFLLLKQVGKAHSYIITVRLFMDIIFMIYQSLAKEK